MRSIVLSMSVLGLAGGLRADETPPATPKQPTLSMARAQVGGDFLRCEILGQHFRPEKQSYTVTENGRTVQYLRTVMVPYEVEGEHRIVALKDVGVYVSGNVGADPTKRLSQLDPTKLADLLKKGAEVVATTDLQKVDPAELKALKPGTIVLVLSTSKSAPGKPLPPAEPMPRAK